MDCFISMCYTKVIEVNKKMQKLDYSPTLDAYTAYLDKLSITMPSETEGSAIKGTIAPKGSPNPNYIFSPEGQKAWERWEKTGRERWSMDCGYSNQRRVPSFH